MNKNISQPEEVVNFGAIKIIGGENTDWKAIIPEDDEMELGLENPLRSFNVETLRGLVEELEENLVYERNIMKQGRLRRKIAFIRKMIARKSKRFSHKIYTNIGVNYMIENLTESMINCGIHNYEIKKEGDKMNEIIDIKREVSMKIDGKLVIKYLPDKTIRYNHPKDETNEGELTNKDLIALYFSGRIGTRKEEKNKHLFEPLIDKAIIHTEDQIIPGIRTMMNFPGILWVLIRNHLVPIGALRRKTYTTNDKHDDEISFLLNLQGDAIQIKECSYYNKDDDFFKTHPEAESRWINLRALSWNMLNYNDNHTVIIAEQSTLNHIDNRIKKLHKEYYHFENKEGKLIHGIYGLNSSEEEALKKIKKEKFGFDESEITELFDCLKDIDGRQSIINIEHDIRNHIDMKYILQKSSNELFVLKIALEDTPEYAEDVLNKTEYESYQEVIGYLEKQMKKVTNKKITALRNIVSGLHLKYEDEENMSQYLSEELDEIDKVSRERGFDSKNYKTHRNYYSQTEGVLAPNGNPQTTHRRRSNPPSMERLRILRKQNKYEIGGKYSGVSDSKKLMEIYDGVEVPRHYSYNARKALGIKYPQEKEIIDATIEELGYWLLGKKVWKEYWTLNKEVKYPAPQFRVPPEFKIKEVNPLKICNMCANEWKCFIKKCKILANKQTLIQYAKKELYMDEDDEDIIKEVYKEVEGYLSKHRKMFGERKFNIRIPKEKAIKFGFIEEESSSSTPYILKIGDNMYKINTSINNKEISLYAKGNIDALSYPSISIAGIRKPAKETIKFIDEVIDDLSDEFVIISGLAKGCDTIAHERCLKNNGITIAVLPSGFNNIVPYKNKELAQKILDNDGLLISEYPPESKAKDWKFVKRNRIIAGLSNTVIICEAGNGTKHTARFSEEQGKNILVQNINTFNNNSMVELGIGKWYHRDRVI